MVSIRLADSMLPALARDFHAAPAQASGTITFFALAYGLMQLVWGPLGDRLGKLRVIAWATIAATVGSLLCALAPSLPMLVAARLVTGACCAAIIPMAIAYVGDSVAYEQRQAALARFATGTLTGLIAGQLIGGLAADTVGWRAAFFLVSALFLVTGLAVLKRSRLTPPEPGVVGSAPPPARSLVQRYAVILRSGWSRWILIAALLEGAIMFGPMAFIPTWLHQDTGLSLAAAGGIAACVGVGGLLFALSARHWVARLGERGLVTTGSVIIALAFAALTWTVRWGPRPAVGAGALACCLAVGFGFYMLHNTLQTLASQMSAESRATAVGLFAVAIFLGQSIGVSTVARLLHRVNHGTVITLAGLAIALLGTLLAARIGRQQAT